MSSPFGFLLPPLAPLVPPELEAQTMSTNQLAYNLPASTIGSHICVFLLPGQSLPAGSAAALYIQFPGQSDFRFLGALGEAKASAVFRVAGLKPGGSASEGAGTTEVDMDADNESGAAAAMSSASGHVTIGVSLEPADQVAAKVVANQTNSTSNSGGSSALVRSGAAAGVGAGSSNGATVQPPNTKILAQRIIQNAFNFLASFEGGSGMVPIKAFEGWWKKFEARVANDPGFLEREQN